jgi:hypothetical protein
MTTVVIPSVIMLSIVIRGVVLLGVIWLGVVMLGVFMLSVVVPIQLDYDGRTRFQKKQLAMTHSKYLQAA